MASWDKICRVCASPAQYDIFSKIPAYLHAASNEFIGWQKPINILIEETTGFKVSQDDGLPKCICALCISYLKHAATFRDQVIRNALSLQAIKKLRDEKQMNNIKDKNSLLITEQELRFSDSRKLDANMLLKTIQNDKDAKVSKSLFQPAPAAMPSQEYIIQQMRYLNLLFDKDINAGIAEVGRQYDADEPAANNRPYVDPMADYETESTSNDENDGENFRNSARRAERNMFSYSEKNFEEDDIMNLDELRDAINVNIPENCKERKCRACFRRFMFEDSYEQHMENCIEYKFLNFIEEINVLLDVRRKKAVSPHEFIRRMIFSLRKVCDFLKINCDEILLPDELAINNERTYNKQSSKTEEKESDDQQTVLFPTEQRRESPVNFERAANKENTNYNLNELLLGGNQQQHDKNSLGTATPISIHNNILYEIERAQSVNAILNNDTEDKPKNIDVQDNNNVKLMRPIPMHATPTSQPIQQPQPSPVKLSEDERLTFMQKLEQLNVYQTPQRDPNQRPPFNTPSISVRKDLMPKAKIVPASPQYCSAACNMCNAIFETISDFELHNAMYHNSAVTEIATTDGGGRVSRSSDEERERIIAMFENEDEI